MFPMDYFFPNLDEDPMTGDAFSPGLLGTFPVIYFVLEDELRVIFLYGIYEFFLLTLDFGSLWKFFEDLEFDLICL